jgi:hypothetical protein
VTRLCDNRFKTVVSEVEMMFSIVVRSGINDHQRYRRTCPQHTYATHGTSRDRCKRKFLMMLNYEASSVCTIDDVADPIQKFGSNSPGACSSKNLYKGERLVTVWLSLIAP